MRKKEGCFIRFNTLKRSDDLLLFKTGMHFPLVFVIRDKRGNKSVSLWKGITVKTATSIGKVAQI